MERLLYISAASEQMSDEDIASILAASRRNNAAAGISGLLLHIDNGFLQVLEGPKDAVAETYARIARDPRHRQLLTLWREPAEQRLFAGWSMGFDRMDKDKPEWEGAFPLDPAKAPETIAPGAGTEILTLMQSFYETSGAAPRTRVA